MADVPNVPGVPALSSFSNELPTLLSGDNISILDASPQQWGLYLGGAPVIVADTVNSFDYKQEWLISDYPVEQGAFESYDKVQTPFTARIRFTSGGSEANKQSLLSSISAVAGTLTLFDAVTPEAIYENVCVSGYNYARTAPNGAGLLTVDVIVEEIRLTAATALVMLSPNSPASAPLQDTQSPSGADPVSDGNVQTLTPSALQSAAASGAIPDATQ